MPELALRSHDDNASEAKRRKVRKGTRSCWECRRRKVRCQFFSEDAAICLGCEAKGTSCVSQEFPDEQPHSSDRGISNRLGRVEDLLEKLVDKFMPEAAASYTPESRVAAAASSASAEDDFDSEEHCPFTVGNPPINALLQPLRDDGSDTVPSPVVLTPTSAQSGTDLPPRLAQISKNLHSEFPSQREIDAVSSGFESQFITSFLADFKDVLEGRVEPTSSISEIPPATSHPALLAKRLMQLANCMEQLRPGSLPFHMSKESLRGKMRRMVTAVSNLVTCDDDLVGSVEGLETLCLLVLYHANAGNLRKGWLVLRRTLAITQLMGIDRWGDKPLKSVDPKSNPETRTRARSLWFRLVFSDRFLSLLLGVPAGTDDNSFFDPGSSPNDSPMDAIEKQHAVIGAAIIKRNCNQKSDSAFSVTHSIDCELDQIAKSMPPSFWQPVRLDKFSDNPTARLESLGRVLRQMHHYHLIILLHLPYMLRDPKERRWDYSKTMCMSSSRKLLRTFLVFRGINDSAFACRHTDYGALTAAMTLLLGYLDPKLQARDEHTNGTRAADRKLVQEVRDTLHDMAVKNDDKMSREAADIMYRLLPLTDMETISRLAPDGADLPGRLRLEIPWLGTINIKPTRKRRRSLEDFGQPALSTALNEEVDPLYAGHPASTAEQSGLEGLDASHMPDHGAGFMSSLEDFSFDPMQFEATGDHQPYAQLAAGADQWTFQGFDATYFDSLFSQTSF
ncbi:hypothetical protein F5Y15DRAFT_12300 [Xylariaceae sp. FL0016]|nr:hypothetical protein F5Y15DRAFT_12300 [Xylariaceae sp. FL0016]